MKIDYRNVTGFLTACSVVSWGTLLYFHFSQVVMPLVLPAILCLLASIIILIFESDF